MCMAMMLVNETIYQVGTYLKARRHNKINCMLLAIRGLSKMFPNNGWQIDIISKHKLFRHMGGGKEVGLSNTQQSHRLQMGMHSVWWDIYYIIQ